MGDMVDVDDPVISMVRENVSVTCNRCGHTHEGLDANFGVKFLSTTIRLRSWCDNCKESTVVMNIDISMILHALEVKNDVEPRGSRHIINEDLDNILALVENVNDDEEISEIEKRIKRMRSHVNDD